MKNKLPLSIMAIVVFSIQSLYAPDRLEQLLRELRDALQKSYELLGGSLEKLSEVKKPSEFPSPEEKLNVLLDKIMNVESILNASTILHTMLVQLGARPPLVERETKIVSSERDLKEQEEILNEFADLMTSFVDTAKKHQLVRNKLEKVYDNLRRYYKGPNYLRTLPLPPSKKEAQAVIPPPPPPSLPSISEESKSAHTEIAKALAERRTSIEDEEEEPDEEYEDEWPSTKLLESSAPEIKPIVPEVEKKSVPVSLPKPTLPERVTKAPSVSTKTFAEQLSEAKLKKVSPEEIKKAAEQKSALQRLFEQKRAQEILRKASEEAEEQEPPESEWE